MTAIFDGAQVDDGAPLLSARSRAVRYGDGVFETMRAYQGRPFALEQHLERLRASADWARLAWPPQESLASEIERASRAVDADAAVRVFLLRGEGPTLGESPTHRLVTAEPLPHGRELRSGTAIIAGGSPTTAGRAIKYMRYLPHLLAQDDARARGAEEALVCDADGRVVEGATSNVFAVIGGDLVTPAESSGILPGITRGVVLRLAAITGAGLRVAQRPIEPAELERASELFITSSLREIFAITRVGARTIGRGDAGPITQQLHAAYRRLTGG